MTLPNPSIMPPCHKMLEYKIKRANFVAAIWRRAASPSPITYRLEGNGWVLKDGKYNIKWCDGDQVPRVLGQVTGPCGPG